MLAQTPPKTGSWYVTMPIWKQILLSLYYYASCPVRWWNRCEAVSEERVPIIVLYYHRIADDRASPWTTSNRMFARQIDWLRRRFDLISDGNDA